MSFNLAGFLGLRSNANINTYGNGDATVSTGSLNINSSSLSAKLLALLPGQMVQGEVVSAQGNQIQLLLGNEMLLNAMLENQVGIQPGQLMSFQVKSNSGSLISLIPLSVNLTTDENVMKALNEASLPVTDKTVEMVNTLMKEGMPIDKETLLNVNKQLLAFPDVDVETIVQMERLKIPITSENIAQFEAYKNCNHKISDGIADLQNQLNALVNTGGKTEGTAVESPQEFLNQLLKFYGEGAEEINFGQSIKSNVGNIGEGMEQADVLTENASAGVTDGKETLNDSEKQALISFFKELGVSQKTLSLFENGQLNTKQLAALLQTENLNGEQLTKLFSSKEFSKLLQNELAEQLLLKPEQITKEQMDEYYTNLKNQTEKLLHILENTGRADTPAAKSLHNLNQNVDFLNQMNQMFTYVQLPLKMAKNTAHGDLYVYTNKKNLMKKDGNVSALLHLDMPHLGMVDVYVAMQAERVSTKFYLQDESMLDFLEGHMNLLTERLEKKGYQANVQMVLKEKEETETAIMQEILKQEKNIPEMKKIATRSFDVRA
ncbi:MAG: flagellar hook-length control protein FliK [Lachnospiraceae bacterium]|nr:flagellar hook-length control protein FliK [Lachnospiraceae bacterium]